MSSLCLHKPRQAVVVQASNPSTQEADLCEFKISLVHMLNSRLSNETLPQTKQAKKHKPKPFQVTSVSTCMLPLRLHHYGRPQLVTS